MRTALIVLALATASAGITTTAWAQNPATPGIDQRQQTQAQRIDQGQASGQVTARESRRLDRQQARINRAESAAKSDGAVTHGERKRLRAMQSGASKRIHQQKHDGQQQRGARRALPPSGPGTGPNVSPGG